MSTFFDDVVKERAAEITNRRSLYVEALKTASPQPCPSPCGCERCVTERIEAAFADKGPQYRGPGLEGWAYACEKCGEKLCPHHLDHRAGCEGVQA